MANLNYDIPSSDRVTFEEYLKIRLQVTDFLDSPEYRNRKTLYSSLSKVKQLMIDVLAEQIYNHSREIEPAISSFVVDLVSDSEGRIIGYRDNDNISIEHCVKGLDGIKRKIAQKGKFKYKGDFVKAARDLRDGVRYTIIVEDEIYLDKVDEYLHSIENSGFRVVSFKNQWGERGCQGINTKIMCPNNTDVFEIQFHTPQGHDIKETSTRDLYQILRDSEAPIELRREVNRLRRFFQSTVPEPDNEYMKARDYQFVSGIDKDSENVRGGK